MIKSDDGDCGKRRVTATAEKVQAVQEGLRR